MSSALRVALHLGTLSHQFAHTLLLACRSVCKRWLSLPMVGLSMLGLPVMGLSMMGLRCLVRLTLCEDATLWVLLLVEAVEVRQ